MRRGGGKTGTGIIVEMNAEVDDKLACTDDGTMLDVWKKQFSAEKFSLKHEDPRIFTSSQWQKTPAPSIYYLLYRIVMTSFLFVGLLLSWVDEQNLDKPASFRVKWTVYLTNWGFLVCSLQAVLCTVMLCMRFHASRKGPASEDTNFPMYKIYWAANVIAVDFSIGITILYWALIYNDSTKIDYLNILTHATNSVSMIIELSIVAHPVKLGHFYISMIFGLVYSIFSCVYYYAGGTSRDGDPRIYNILDWRKPISTSAICIGAVIFIAIIHSITYIFYRIRLKLADKLIKTEDANNEKADIQITDLKF